MNRNRKITKCLFDFDKKLKRNGYFLAGADEVGRGCLAGPVLTCCVILKESRALKKYLIGLNDSKKLTAIKREKIYPKIISGAIASGIGIVSNRVIDKINISEATNLAMKIAVRKCIRKVRIKRPVLLLIDGNFRIYKRPPKNIIQYPIIKGDTKSASIAAASIIAKVTRDNLMRKLDGKFPGYSFSKHKGYPTKEHLKEIKKCGILNIHRKTYQPLNRELSLNWDCCTILQK